LIEEQENRSKLFRTRYLDVEFERTDKELRHLYIQDSRASTPAKEEVLPVHPTKESQQCKVTIPKEDNN